MADFHTHISVAAVGSGLLATLCLGSGWVSQTEALGLWFAGTLGGILPDIDSDKSTSIQIIFTVLATLVAFSLMFTLATEWSVMELWIIWLGGFLVVRYGMIALFKQMTVHRGIFHSIMAGLLFCFMTAAVSYQWFKIEHFFSWLLGFFILIGFLTHLILDELYSIDFLNNKLKSSAGTAFKLIDYNNKAISGLMILAVFISFLLTPSLDSVIALLYNPDTWHHLSTRLWPQEAVWFQ